jgi:hypothetical protein
MEESPGFLLRLNHSASRYRKLELLKKTTSVYGFLGALLGGKIVTQ